MFWLESTSTDAVAAACFRERSHSFRERYAEAILLPSSTEAEGLRVSAYLAAMEEKVPANVLTASLFARYRSRIEHTYGDKVLSAMRFGFGGHTEIPQ